MKNINECYTTFYKKRTHKKVYPTEFVVRTFLAHYPELNMKKPEQGAKVLDVGVGDGRNTLFLCEQGYDVYGTEITAEIVEQTSQRLQSHNFIPDLRIGRNNDLPFEDSFFNVILACHVCYYCDEGETILDNLQEYSRVLKKDGYLIASVANTDSYLFKNSKKLDDGSMIITSDPYGNRNGYRLFGFETTIEIENLFSKYFNDFSFGQAHNNYYGIDENVYWVVCKKREGA